LTAPVEAIGGVVYVGSGVFGRYGYVDARDPWTGELLWRYEIADWSPSLLDLVGDVLYVVESRGHFVYALDAATGEFLWRYPGGDTGDLEGHRQTCESPPPPPPLPPPPVVTVTILESEPTATPAPTPAPR